MLEFIEGVLCWGIYLAAIIIDQMLNIKIFEILKILQVCQT